MATPVANPDCFSLENFINGLLKIGLSSKTITCLKQKSNWKLVLENLRPDISKIHIIVVSDLISFICFDL